VCVCMCVFIYLVEGGESVFVYRIYVGTFLHYQPLHLVHVPALSRGEEDNIVTKPHPRSLSGGEDVVGLLVRFALLPDLELLVPFLRSCLGRSRHAIKLLLASHFHAHPVYA